MAMPFAHPYQQWTVEICINIVRNFHVDAWKTRGHMRTYKSGKTVYIKETTHHRKAHNGDAQNVKMIVKSLKE